MNNIISMNISYTWMIPMSKLSLPVINFLGRSLDIPDAGKVKFLVLII
jgi:hypothetical protein